jgi:mannose-1-phosphate guanylyltransferase
MAAELAAFPADHRWGVILAGGDGVRLRPLTRLACGDNRPKQFCPLLGGKTLLAHTRSRISRTITSDHVLFALTQTHEPFFAHSLGQVAPSRKIIQPVNRGTLPAILWSLLRVAQLDPDAIIAFLPSDHYFSDELKFQSVLESAFSFAETHLESVVLLGAVANAPETEYGWIEPGAEQGKGFFGVKRFWEKPSYEVALRLFDDACLWNTFVMIGSAKAFFAMVRSASPGVCGIFELVLADAKNHDSGSLISRFYKSLSPMDFSRDVLSGSTEMLAVIGCGEVGWNDLGDPRRFMDVLSQEGISVPDCLAEYCNECRRHPELIEEPLTDCAARALANDVVHLQTQEGQP